MAIFFHCQVARHANKLHLLHSSFSKKIQYVPYRPKATAINKIEDRNSRSILRRKKTSRCCRERQSGCSQKNQVILPFHPFQSLLRRAKIVWKNVRPTRPLTLAQMRNRRINEFEIQLHPAHTRFKVTVILAAFYVEDYMITHQNDRIRPTSSIDELRF